MADRGLVLTGARARLSIEGTKVMYATGVNYGEDIEHVPVEVLDQLDVAEHVPVAYRVNFSASMVRLIKNPIKNRDGIAIMPTLESILTSPELEAQIEDPTTGSIIATIQRVRCTSHRSGIDTKSMVIQNVEFVAIRILDESEVATGPGG